MTTIKRTNLPNGDVELEIPAISNRILHVTFDADAYTTSEIEAIATMFTTAALEPAGAVVVTRSDISARFVESAQTQNPNSVH